MLIKSRAILLFFVIFPLQSALWPHGGDHGPELRHMEIASADPDRVFLSFNGDPATSRAVNWRTDASIEVAFAEIAPADGSPDFQENAVRVDAVTEKLDLNRYTGNTQGLIHYHSALFTGLQPDTLYAYRVGDGKSNWSEWIQFRTASSEDQPFSFLYFGDAQNDIFSRWSRVIRMAHQTAPDARFAVHAGDLINHGHTDVEWAEWFSAGSYLHSQLTGVPVCGNHEYRPLNDDPAKYRSIQWRHQFNLPVEQDLPEDIRESVYTVEYQNMQLIVLDTNAMIAEQTAYLEKQLRRDGFDWRMVTYHHSLYSPLGRSGETYELMLEQWVPLFNKYGVDLVLQGHDHLYARGQMDPAVLGRSEAGPVYVTSVSGPKQYEMKKEAMENLRQIGYKTVYSDVNTQYFQVIHIDGSELSYKSYDATGLLQDSFRIIRNKAGKGKSIVQ